MLKFIEKELQKKHSENVKLKKDIALKKEQFIDLKRWYEKSIENLSTSFQKEIQATNLKYSKQETTDRLINEKLELKVKQLEIDLGELDHLRNVIKPLNEELKVLKDEKKNKHCLFTKVEIHVGEGYTQTEIALRPDNSIAQSLTLLATYTRDDHEAKYENTEPDFSDNNLRVLPLFKKFIIEDLCDQLGYKLHIEEGDV